MPEAARIPADSREVTKGIWSLPFAWLPNACGTPVLGHRLLAQPLLWGGRAGHGVLCISQQGRDGSQPRPRSWLSAACLSFPESLMDEPSQRRGGQGQARSAFLKAVMDWLQDCAAAALFEGGKRGWDLTRQPPGEVLVSGMRRRHVLWLLL